MLIARGLCLGTSSELYSFCIGLDAKSELDLGAPRLQPYRAHLSVAMQRLQLRSESLNSQLRVVDLRTYFNLFEDSK